MKIKNQTFLFHMNKVMSSTMGPIEEYLFNVVTNQVEAYECLPNDRHSEVSLIQDFHFSMLKQAKEMSSNNNQYKLERIMGSLKEHPNQKTLKVVKTLLNDYKLYS